VKPPIFSDRAPEAGGVELRHAEKRNKDEPNVPRDAVTRNHGGVIYCGIELLLSLL
jgi:hypothetical protein